MSTRTIRVCAVSLAAGCFAAVSATLPLRAATGSEAKSFQSPEQAVSAVVAALRAGDQPAVRAILGPSSERILESGDPAADRLAVQRFLASYDAAHAIQRSSDAHAELVTGSDQWPFPIPLVKQKPGWRFDTPAGEQEILARRIGRNERHAIQACLAFVDAQREYWERNPDGAPLLHYARRLISSEGRRDGLYYPTGEQEQPSPIGETFARARAAGYGFEPGAPGSPAPFLGYFYRMLEKQGPRASHGAYSYVAGAWMIGGFALVAHPATYDNSGVMTFLVNQDGVVFQKDLGPDTAKLAAGIESFDPDETWTKVSGEDLVVEMVSE